MTFSSKVGRWLYRNLITDEGYRYNDATVYRVRRIIGGDKFVGQAIGNCIFVVPPVSERLLKHEYAHVLQWRRYGGLGFILRYFGAFLGNYLTLLAEREPDPFMTAYLNIPLEIEARAAENN